VQSAYEQIGYTKSYADSIFVEAHEAPDEEILRMHRVAVQSTTDPSEKAMMGQALDLIGRHRSNQTMRRLGGSGQSLMSVEEAYAALSAPSDSIDDGLIMSVFHSLQVFSFHHKRPSSSHKLLSPPDRDSHVPTYQ
jgi:ubiquitin carboxyl-terminal hydrolase 25/28